MMELLGVNTSRDSDGAVALTDIDRTSPAGPAAEGVLLLSAPERPDPLVVVDVDDAKVWRHYGRCPGALDLVRVGWWPDEARV